jgi:PAS domain S-box-containing protein
MMMRDDIAEMVLDFQARLASLQGKAASDPKLVPGSRLVETEKLVNQAIEELRVTDEELRQQNEAFVEVREQLEAELAQYRDLFWSAPVAYLVTDLDGIIRRANLLASRLLGVPEPRLVGKPLAIYFPPSQQPAFRALLSSGRNADEPIEWETILRPRGDEPIAVVARVGAARDVFGERVGLRWLVRVEAAAARLPSDQSTAGAIDKGDNAGRPVEGKLEQRLDGVLQDLRNPVLVMMDQARFLDEQLLALGGPETVDVASALSTVAATASETIAAIDEVRDALDLEAGVPLALDRDASDLLAIAQHVVSSAQARSERRVVRLELDRSTRPGLIGFWDEERLDRALANVLAVAMRSSPDTGRIAVRVSRAIAEDGPRAVIQVAQSLRPGDSSDASSTGLAADAALQRTTGRVRGESLGLAGARQIVEQHGGRLLVRDPGPARRVFEISLPFEPGDVP